MRGFLGGLRKSFLAGLLLVLPAAVTVYILYLGFVLIGGLSRPAVEAVRARLGIDLPPGAAQVLSLLLTFVALVLLGSVGRSYAGSRLLKLVDAAALRIPFAKTLYSATRKLIDSFSSQKEFQKVVLVEFPRPGMWVMGFCTGESGSVLSKAVGEDLVNVFIPTTPNPTSGYLVLVPRSSVRFLDLTVEEGASFIISGGVVAPALARPGAEGPG